MNRPLFHALLAALVGAGVTSAFAAGAAGDEQKAAAREKAKAKWESMTPEEKAAAKKAFAQRHPDAANRMAERQRAASAPAGR